ncbi:uncharacterized protein LOC111613855 [Centruroides sculpturatus]|uniref:uncharacterized protein LOC111613855 n=1 Tax=Centruroides sculpturatus TaxID=218467 RepID=UPI000C6E5939|nr:uncharacterized protein LOC111613855 [Centruroides sculpturatus]
MFAYLLLLSAFVLIQVDSTIVKVCEDGSECRRRECCVSIAGHQTCMKRPITGGYCNPNGGNFLDEEKEIYEASCPCPADQTCILGKKLRYKVYTCKRNKFIKTTTEQPEVIEEIVTTEQPEVIEEIVTTEEPEVIEEIVTTDQPEVIEEILTTEQPEVIEEIVNTEEPEVEEIVTTETSEEIISVENPENIENPEESNQ